MFQDDESRLNSGPIDIAEKLSILEMLGLIAQEKYDEFVVQGGSAKGYSLDVLKGSLKFKVNPVTFDNDYYLEGRNEHWTKVAIYFEYGTGLFNQKRAGKYRAGYIKPVIKEYMAFVAKDGKFVMTDRVKGVHPIFAMTKAIKYIEFNRRNLQREIRLQTQNG